ncbi:hypothetical protein BSG1_09438 [Bacillus sp. SG-1]|nr:hypothetical protein BSG1_09438 [Bacillus sp. SG-1]
MGQDPALFLFSLGHFLLLWASIQRFSSSYWAIFSFCGPASGAFPLLIGPFSPFVGQYPALFLFLLGHFF